jgi:hypothetical protein
MFTYGFSCNHNGIERRILIEVEITKHSLVVTIMVLKGKSIDLRSDFISCLVVTIMVLKDGDGT